MKMNSAKNVWNIIVCPKSELQLSATLTGGQSFRWRKYQDDQWIGVMANCLWILKQSDDSLMYRVLGELPYPEADVHQDDLHLIRMKVVRPEPIDHKPESLLYATDYYNRLLTNYFRLDINLKEYYDQWSSAHEHFRNSAKKLYAVRVLNQDPIENVFSFICSQNNNVSRITTLVEKLCGSYGRKICKFEKIDYYTFPNFDVLSKPKVEAELRAFSFGYRAKFINKSAKEIMEKGGLKWFSKLERLNYKDAHSELLTLTGIGPKVADCICLMSLNHLQSIPVDTHVYQMARNHYMDGTVRKTKSITSKMYTEIGDRFRDIYGPLAGWAQTVLFCADLAKFKDLNERV